MKNLYLIICFLALCGCSGFLEEYSQDKSYIKGYDDLDEILLGNAYFERFYVTNGWQFSGIAGEANLACLHVMSDELAQQTKGDSWVDEGACGTSFGYHTWQYRVYENLEGKTAWDDAADFRHLYAHINACNIILDEVKAYENVTEEEDVQNVSRIKGESYFLRGSCYFFLVNLYGKPYAKATAGNDPAVPIKLSNNVEDKYYQRSSVAEVYKQVVAGFVRGGKVFEGCAEEIGVAGGYCGNEIDVESCVPVYV